MADFASNQQQLAAARSALEKAQLAATQAAARAQKAQATVVLATRQHAAQREGGTLAQLQAEAKQALAASDAAKAALQKSRASLASVAGDFAVFTDPRQNVGRLSDAIPFLLFPVRIETRFRTIVSQGPPGIAAPPVKHQLWVRIYPDDCSIDTFEPILSDSELANVKTYWMNIYRAGGVENDERGAWRALVSSQGSGRAGWLVDNFQPTNLAAKPKKAAETDEILVIPTTTALNAAEATAISNYWQAVWLADGDAVKQQAALNALNAAVGAARASDLIAGYVPFNLTDKPADPLTKADVALSTAFVIFPPDPVTSLQSWTQAPQVKQLPDRFVVLGFSGINKTLEVMGNPVTLPLYTGPDPSGDPTETIRPDPAPDGPDLLVPDELKWMVDFDRAVAAGMALAIDLTPDQAANGFDLLMVLGLQLSATAEGGAAALQELLLHHQTGRSGFAIVPQGTPAHNATGAGSGYSRIDDSDASFNDRKNLPLFTPTADPLQQLDGQWFAEFLGIDPAFMATVHASNTPDQKQARAMQTAMWPATLGYWMNTLFTPTGGQTSIFSDETIDQMRAFFIQFVSGRGALPAVRIGGQPYGVLPTTAFSRIQWYQPEIFREAFLPANFLARLYGILRQLDADWTAMGNTAHWVGEGGDSHQTLLNVLAHHASSVEYYSRTAESLAQLYNMLNFWALAPTWWQAILNLNLQAQAVALLQRFGYSGAALPDLLNHFYLTSNPQTRVVVDDRPLSETDPIRPYTQAGDNYITWLIKESGSLETLRAETGFLNNQSPQTLLYLYMRHALMLGYYESSYNYHRNTGVLSGPALLAMRVEPAFIHVNASATASESRFAALYKSESRITGSPTHLVSEFIGSRIGLAAETANLAEQVDALKILATASTAQLERLFAEHVDIVSYRYDAWLLGLVNQHIQSQRAAVAAAAANNGGKSGGIYLGAYAWVEHLKPSAAEIVPVQIPPELAAQFPGTEPLMTDPAGGGYIHAPSMQHADTAAVLRAGYLANADNNNPDMLAVNLSSDRVRVALTLIEGIRNGQSLGALLGYRFERGLHDDFVLAEVDQFIYPLRKAFPLVADQMASTKTDPNVPIEAIEARNVLDGKKLVDRIQTIGNKVYPYGLSDMPNADPDQQKALNDVTNSLLDAYDALADLALAEGVHQAAQGNYDRVASTIEAYTTGNFPPEPQVVQTPPAGIGITHRVGLQFRPGLAAPAGATPRAQAEPAINDWLNTFLPALNNVESTVIWNDPITGTPQQHPVTLADLNLRPIDVLYLLKPENVKGMTELDDRVIRKTIADRNPRPDAVLQIQYLTAGPNQFSMFEAGALLRELRTILTHSRPLRASDVRRSNDASQKDDSRVFADAARIATPLTDLKTLAGDINAFLATLSPLLLDTTANRVTIISRNDDTLFKAIEFLERASLFAMPSSGWGFAYDWLRASFTDLLKMVSDLVKRWDQKLLEFKSALLAYDALPAGTGDADRYAALQAAELLVSSTLEPLPPTPAKLRSDLDSKGDAFRNRRQDFANILASAGTSFTGLLNSVAALSVSEFDSQPFDLTQFGDRAIIVSEDVARILGGQFTAITARTAEVDKQLATAASAASASDQVQAIQAAAKALLGGDFQIVPEFTLSPAQGGEWANALGAFNSGKLLDYLKNTENIDFPVDEWLYGAARVRPMLHSWESALMFDAAFGIKPPELKPIQLPFVADDPWLALQYPSDHVIDSDRLLYTCAYTVDFDPNARQCGLLFDEWTEVIPVMQRDTAITFNYNRPDNEPPQSMLLVTSPAVSSTWQWDDLVAALVETLALAKKRAIEPSFLDPTVYSRFLPATVTASTSYAITISTALTAANGVFEAIQGGRNA
jgi:hypothetical protein